jgi:hypothetical protein
MMRRQLMGWPSTLPKRPPCPPTVRIAIASLVERRSSTTVVTVRSSEHESETGWSHRAALTVTAAGVTTCLWTRKISGCGAVSPASRTACWNIALAKNARACCSVS